MKEYSESYAVDFDGTLSLGKWPEIGEPNIELFEFLKRQQLAGDKVILWTCREGELLQAAVEWCEEQGLVFDAVNDHLKENKEKFENSTRKVFASYYIDDRNLELSKIAGMKQLEE